MTTGSRVLAIVFLLAGVAAHVPALSADELESSITSAEEAAGAMAVDVDREGPGAVAVQLDVGQELYLRVSDGRVVDRERELLDAGERRVLREIQDGATYLHLADAYRRALSAMEETGDFDPFGASDFESIGYGRERGRSVIEVSFEQGDRDLALYLDPETGEILFSDLDDH